MTATTLGLRRTDIVRREWYLTRLDWAMQDYPRKAFRQIRRDLRAQLTLAAADVGMAQALRDVGHPRVLAEQYVAELGRRLPRWVTGAVAAGLTIGAVMYIMVAYGIGTLDTIEAMGGGTVTYVPFGTEFVFTHTEDMISVESTGLSWGWFALYAGAGLLAFIPASRIWRAFGGRRRSTPA